VTVTRQSQREIERRAPDFMACAIAYLSRSDRVHSLTFDEATASFVYRPSGWPLVLSTRAHIAVRVEGAKTQVSISTTSQPFILGDVFRAYDRLIDRLFRELGSCMR
jgi:hypothetical protein